MRVCGGDMKRADNIPAAIRGRERELAQVSAQNLTEQAALERQTYDDSHTLAPR